MIGIQHADYIYSSSGGVCFLNWDNCSLASLNNNLHLKLYLEHIFQIRFIQKKAKKDTEKIDWNCFKMQSKV